MNGDVNAAAAQAAETLQEAARSHKRLAAHHRREAQRLQQRRADLLAKLAKAGIHIDPTEPEEAQSHG